MALGAAGCSADSGNDSDALLHDDFLVPIDRSVDDMTVAAQDAAMTDSGLKPSNHDEFYLALRRSNLADKWFWSVYQKQTSFNGPSPNTLGTKVVRFQIQNDKLYVFDADVRRATSDVFSPDLIIDAFPIVSDNDHFNSLPGSGGYVLIDPAAGQNQFGALADYWSGAEVKLSTELSFVQDFHAASDGGRYEQVVTTYADQPIDFGGVADNPYRIAATLGVNIRHYFEGDNYQEVAAPDLPHYFLGEPRIIPNTGIVESDPEHWNFHPGMKPIRWVIGKEIIALENDPNLGNGADLFGAIKRGIESWNDVLGYPVFTAELATDNDEFDDDHVNYFIVDPDVSVGFAFADWRANPNTGEIRGASVYFSAAFLLPFPDDAAAAAKAIMPQLPRKHPTMTWQGMTPKPLCMLDVHDRDRHATTASPALTGQQKLELYIQEVTAHEVGHTLGLRHNFEGSLVPPTSSVMDYNLAEVAFAQPTPGPYDLDAIRYLYSQSPDLPTQPFCTDENVGIDPNCQTFDGPSPTPLYDFQIPSYQEFTPFLLEGDFGTDAQDIQIIMAEIGTQMFDYIRTGTPTDAAAAWEAAMAGVRAPLDPANQLDPIYATVADQMAADAFIDMFLPAGSFFEIFDSNLAPPSDPSLLATISIDGEKILINLDHVRSYSTRRSIIDALKAAQDVHALEALLDSKTALTAQLPSLGEDDRVQTQDLISRITAATSPYFN